MDPRNTANRNGFFQAVTAAINPIGLVNPPYRNLGFFLMVALVGVCKDATVSM